MGRARRAERRLIAWIVLDSEGVTKAAAGHRLAAAHVGAARQAQVPIVVSAITLAEVLRGHRRDAAVHLLLKSCRIEPVTRDIGRAPGELLGRSARRDTVDAVVVATAASLRGPARILTSDPTDLEALSADLRDVSVRAV